jgi:hypothetical protein
VFCFGFFHVVVLVLLAKQQQQKIVNLFTILVCYAWALVKTQETIFILDTKLFSPNSNQLTFLVLKFFFSGENI